MERIHILDNLRGIAFILMFISHIFYFYDVSTDYTTNTSNTAITAPIGTIARTLFILLAGYSIYMGYKKNKDKYLINRIKRSSNILFHAVLVSYISYVLYPYNFVRFGILHFIAIGTLLLSFIAPFKLLTIILLLLSYYIKYPITNTFIDTMTGSYTNYNMLDYFSLQQWLPIMLIGLIFGQNFNINKLSLEFLNHNSILTTIGRNCLNLYTLHFIIFMLLSKIYHK